MTTTTATAEAAGAGASFVEPFDASRTSAKARAKAARPAPPRLALTIEEAAAALGISRDSFDRFVKDELRLVRRGRLILVSVVELERWLERSAARTLGGDAR